MVINAQQKGLTIALIGNPNSGKTTLFNLLTGSHQYVGNWAGVTVERKEGLLNRGGTVHTVVDLPGLYSLFPYTLEETIARDFLLEQSPDLILNIVDGTNLERNLYLTLQLLELGAPVVVAVNMADELRKRGDRVDYAALSEAVSVPFVPISARNGEGIQQLLSALDRQARAEAPTPVACSQELGPLLEGLTRLYRKKMGEKASFYASHYLEGDTEFAALVLPPADRQLADCLVETELGKLGVADRESALADARYRWIEDLMDHAVIKATAPDALTLSDRIDSVVTGKWTAIPVFLLVMLSLFSFTFSSAGNAMKGALAWFCDTFLGNAVKMLLVITSAPKWCQSLLLDGVLGGVGSVLSFLPQILLLFLFLSFMEDSGYMARAAFVMDRLLARLGLCGKSFIPMLMGFGCTTPAVMAARTMENERDRRMTILLTPFMSCGAKLPIYALFASAFFPTHQGLVVFGIYLLGIFLAIATGLVFKNTLFRGDEAPFLMELPPYRLPKPGTVLRHMWEKCKGFLVKAGTIILAMSVVVWTLQYFTPMFTPATGTHDSIFAWLGGIIAPVFGPLGFGFWQATVALLTGLAAKETVVSTMMVLYRSGSQELLGAALQGVFTPAAALSFMVFSLLYMPCFAAMASMRRELGSWRWTAFSALYQTGIAYVAAFVVYRLALLIL